jgi:hypothetical protein
MVLGLQRKPSPFWAQNALPKGVHASSITIALCPVKRGQLQLPDIETNGSSRRSVVACRRIPVPVSLIEPHVAGLRTSGDKSSFEHQLSPAFHGGAFPLRATQPSVISLDERACWSPSRSDGSSALSTGKPTLLRRGFVMTRRAHAVPGARSRLHCCAGGMVGASNTIGLFAPRP